MLWKSTIKPSSFFILSFVGLMMGALCIHFIYLGLSGEFIDLVHIFFGALMGFFSIGMLYQLTKKIIIHKDRIILKSLLNSKTFYWKDIRSWEHFKFTNDKKIDDYLLFKTDSKIIDLSSYSEFNPDSIPYFKTYAHQSNGELYSYFIAKRKRITRNIIYVMSILFFIPGSILVCCNLFSNPTNYITLHNTLQKEPLLHDFNRSKRIPSITFDVGESFKFRATGEQAKNVNLDLLNQMKIGDDIILQIKEDDLHQKINKTEAPSFSKKHINWDIIEVYGIEHQEKFIAPFRSSKNSSNNLESGLVLISLGICIFGYYFFFMDKK